MLVGSNKFTIAYKRGKGTPFILDRSRIPSLVRHVGAARVLAAPERQFIMGEHLSYSGSSLYIRISNLGSAGGSSAWDLWGWALRRIEVRASADSSNPSDSTRNCRGLEKCANPMGHCMFRRPRARFVEAIPRGDLLLIRQGLFVTRHYLTH